MRDVQPVGTQISNTCRRRPTASGLLSLCGAQRLTVLSSRMTRENLPERAKLQTCHSSLAPMRECTAIFACPCVSGPVSHGGCTDGRDEGSLFTRAKPNITSEEYTAFVLNWFGGAFGNEILSVYPAAAYSTPFVATSRIWGDYFVSAVLQA